MREILDAAESCYQLKNLCIWNKDNAGLGSFYRSKHELVFVFKSGNGPHVNNFGLGETGRYRTNVWDYRGINTLRPARMEELSLHPTVKPVTLVADAIRDCSKRNGIILDAFAGSGTTLIAAERTGRKAFALELDPKYVDTAIRRWEIFTGGTATHAATGSSLAELAVRRAAQSLAL
jgi:DNA modification methylase